MELESLLVKKLCLCAGQSMIVTPVWLCMAKVALFSFIYPVITLALPFSRRRWGRGGRQGWCGCRVSSFCPPSNVKVSALAPNLSHTHPHTLEPLPAAMVRGGGGVPCCKTSITQDGWFGVCLRVCLLGVNWK